MTHQCEPYSASNNWSWRTIRQYLVTLIPHLLLLSLFIIKPPQEAIAHTLNQIQQTPQRIAGNDGSGEEEVLEPGRRINRELAEGQQHIYQIRLEVDQFLKVNVMQNGIDVIVQVAGSDGKQFMEIDSERMNRARESVAFVADAAGEYFLTVRPKLKAAPAGSYAIWVEELHAATDDDRALHEANKLFKKAQELHRAGKYDEAISLIERTLKIREKILGPEHRDVGTALNNLAIVYRDKSDYARAEPLYQRALAVREKALGQWHPEVAATLSNLALLYSDRGEYAEAEPLYQRALGICEKTLGPEHPDLAYPLTNLAILYRNQGKYTKSEPLYQRALPIFEKALGPEHPTVATALNALAILYSSRGEYARAEPLFLRALAIRKKTLDPEHPLIAESLHNLAVINDERGDYESAERFYRQALAIKEKALGPEHRYLASSLSQLAEIYRKKGEYAKSERLHQRALNIRVKTLGPDHPEVPSSLSYLANLYRDRGNYARAESFYRRSLAILEKSLGPEHPDAAFPLRDLAQIYRNRGEFVKAESLYLRALAIREKALGSEHPRVADSLNDLALLYAAKGEPTRAIAYESRANAIIEHGLTLNLTTGSERQKLAYLATLSDQSDWTISLHLRYAPADPLARKLAASVILQRKGRALDAASGSLNALRSRFNTEDRALLDELADARSQIAKLVLDGPQKFTAERYQTRIRTLEDQAEELEAEISRRSSEFRALSLPVTLAAVQAAIPADAALIEFNIYRLFNVNAANEKQAYGRPRYVAYILRREGEVQWKDLGEAKAIDAAITALRKAMRDWRRNDVRVLARALDKMVFQPLRPLIGEQKRLLISPEGELNLVPFAALVDERGRYRLEQYSISYLGSGRDLLRFELPRKSHSGPLVIANPDFGRRHQVEPRRMLRREKEAPEEPGGGEPTTAVFSRFFFSPLPQTAKEGEALSELLPEATLLTKRHASKSVVSQIRSPALLHIATHGFFLDDLRSGSGEVRKASVKDSGRVSLQVGRGGDRSGNPLLRSGLALAGANEQKREDNGILTALEVSALNLWGTKLVVLSACDTGVGEVKNGDGVYGLRRSLVLAGAETQVMSLWAVSDKATRELMVSYYRKLQQGKGRGDALREVQLEMLKRMEWRHPYYWAGFIQSGEWANLDEQRR
jgi:CHAT domain-containing protein/Flp pilus assembly protein TadD